MINIVAPVSWEHGPTELSWVYFSHVTESETVSSDWITTRLVNNAGRMSVTEGGERFLLRTAGAFHHHDTRNKWDTAGCLLSTKINKEHTHACMHACKGVYLRVFETRKPGEEVTWLGILPPRCGSECNLLMEIEVFGVPGTENEGQIVLVVSEWIWNNSSKEAGYAPGWGEGSHDR